MYTNSAKGRPYLFEIKNFEIIGSFKCSNGMKFLLALRKKVICRVVNGNKSLSLRNAMQWILMEIGEDVRQFDTHLIQVNFCLIDRE